MEFKKLLIVALVFLLVCGEQVETTKEGIPTNVPKTGKPVDFFR